VVNDTKKKINEVDDEKFPKTSTVYCKKEKKEKSTIDNILYLYYRKEITHTLKHHF